jgi:hypothetical protein
MRTCKRYAMLERNASESVDSLQIQKSGENGHNLRSLRVLIGCILLKLSLGLDHQLRRTKDLAEPPAVDHHRFNL